MKTKLRSSGDVMAFGHLAITSAENIKKIRVMKYDDGKRVCNFYFNCFRFLFCLFRRVKVALYKGHI